MSRGHVYQRGRTWTYVLDVGPDPKTGKRGQQSKGGFTTKRDATRSLNEVLIQQQTGTYVTPLTCTVEQFLVKEWLPTKAASLRPSALHSYASNIRLHVLPRLGGLHLQNLRAAHINALYGHLLAEKDAGGAGLSPKTVRNIHAVLRKALADAERWSLLPRNVADLADPPKVRATSHEHKTWTAAELHAFLGCVNGKRLYAAWRVAAMTGMRRGEVLGLRWADLDLDTKRAAVRQTLISVGYKIQYSTPKTPRSRRSVPLDADTVAVLRRHRTAQARERLAAGNVYDDRDLVFAAEDGSPIHPDLFTDEFQRLIGETGSPKIRLHDLRHTHATLALQAGVPAKVVSERLGHATVAFTMDVYTHAIPALQEEAADLVADLVANAT